MSNKHIEAVAKQISRWARQQPRVRALFWYGSYSLGRSRPDSDLDVAILLAQNAETEEMLSSLQGASAFEVKFCTAYEKSKRVCLFLGNRLMKVDCTMANRPEELYSLADSNDVPSPRLVLDFERDGAGQDLIHRAQAQYKVDAAERANEEIEKFLVAFEACSAAHRRSDAYGFYFQYNLALGRLARLVKIVRDKPERLYLPPQLTNTCLRIEERGLFIETAGTMYLADGNTTKRRLCYKFLEFFHELEKTMTMKRAEGELQTFFDAVLLRDHFYNVRDWADNFGGLVRRGILVRASMLTRWQKDPELKRWFAQQAIRRIIDLRTDAEVKESSYRAEVLDGIEYIRVPLPQPAGVKDEFGRGIHRNYAELAFDNLTGLVEVYRTLAQGCGCTVLHCAAGVDRTGFVAALLGMLLDLPEQHIVADYTASGVLAEPKVIAAFMRAIEKRGGVCGLLSAAGLSEDEIEKLKKSFLTN